jgi:8-oxo-dGTP pyrophosphatase MutT (NUDIX family)
MGRVKTLVSAGGVVYKKEGSNVWVALISPHSGIWALPKGLVEGEEIELAALREAEEETGLKGEIEEKLGVIDYWFFDRHQMAKIHKFVHFYLIRYLRGSVENHDWEVDKAQWFKLEEALKKLKYEGEKEILEKACEKLVSSPSHLMGKSRTNNP